MLTLIVQAAQQTAPPAAAASGSQTMLIWAVILLGAAAALFVVEVFVPSGGLLGVISALCLIGGIICMFGVDTTLGLITSIIAILAVPPAIFTAMKIFPNTPVGQWLTLRQTLPDPAVTNPENHSADVRVGDEGTALTDLRPVGACRINGHRVECVAVGPAIEPGQKVSVVVAEGFETRVRAID
ncbi:MAG: NfeD family protein [Planctomycetota bacterium]